MSQPISNTVIEEAAWWQAQLGDDELPEEERAAFIGWIEASPEHRLAFDRMATLADRIQGRSDVHRLAVRSIAKKQPSELVGGLLGVALLLGAGFFALRQMPVRVWMADYRTTTGEQRPERLADGSQLNLDTDTAVNVDMGGTSRDVELLKGALLVEVAHDVRHPFIVHTSDGTARALGTAYSVRKEHDATIVAVAESQVEACTAKSRKCLTLHSGQQARLSATGIERLAPVDPEGLRARAEGWLTVEDAPLVEVLAELNRYRAAPIRFAPDAIADLRVTGVFPLRNSGEALDRMEASMPVAIDRAEPENPLVRRTH